MASIHETVLPASGKTSWFVRYRDPDTGRQRGRRFSTRTDANKFARSVQTDIDRGVYIDPALGKITVAAMLEHYVSVAPIAESTRAGYVMWTNKYVKPSDIGRRKIANVTKADVRKFYAAMTADGVGASTVKHVHQLLHAAFTTAVDEDRIPKNPAHGVGFAKVQRRDAFFLTIDQVERLADEVGPRHGTMIRCLAYMGLRAGEAASLKVRNIDLMNRTARIVDGGTGQTKTRKVRSVPIPRSLVDELAAHMAAWSDPANPDAYVFANNYGGRLNMANFRRRVVHEGAARANILRDGQPPGVHDLRHTAASLWAGSYSLHEVSKMLGHSHIGVTADLYVHLFQDEQAAKADAFDARLRGASAPVDAVVTPLELAPARS